jgi:hypothetical protein
MRIAKKLIASGLVAASAVAWAHGDAEHARPRPVKHEQKPWGIAGDAKAVKRTIEIRMTDDMRFTPDRIEVRQGTPSDSFTKTKV